MEIGFYLKPSEAIFLVQMVEMCLETAPLEKPLVRQLWDAYEYLVLFPTAVHAGFSCDFYL